VAVVLGVAVALAALTGTLISLQRGGGTPAEPPAVPTPQPAGTLIGPPITVGKEPLDVEAGEGFVWVAGSGDGTLSRIDPGTDATERIDVGGVPTEMAVTPGAVWVWNYSDAVTRVDVATGAVGDPVTPNGTGDITGIAAGAGSLWLSHSSSNSVSRIDLATGAPTGTPTTVGAGPAGLAFGTRSLFVVNAGDKTLSVVDGTTAAVSGAPVALGDEAGGVAVSDGVVYVGTTGDVTPIDEASLVVGDPIPLKGGSLFLAGPGGIWVAFPLADELRWFDLAGQESRGGPVTGVGKGVGDLVLHDGRVWLTDTAAGTVVQVQVA
jgi:DNA-binding beta-propeller fold protein YncE